MTAKYFMTFTFLPLLFLARGCVKDSDENNDEADDPIEIHYGKDDVVTKDMAIENWEAFLKQSQENIDAAETNIAALVSRIEEIDNPEKEALEQVCDESNLAILKLKGRLVRRNKEFSNELKNYDASNSAVQQKNEDFKAEFKRDLANINKSLSTTAEKLRSGYYK